MPVVLHANVLLRTSLGAVKEGWRGLMPVWCVPWSVGITVHSRDAFVVTCISRREPLEFANRKGQPAHQCEGHRGGRQGYGCPFDLGFSFGLGSFSRDADRPMRWRARPLA